MITSFKQTYINALKQYYFVGGMPVAVQSFVEEKDFNEVREIQKRILTAYEQDFSKHAPVEIVPKIRMIWNSIPSQLAKENKKFICGLVHKVSRVNVAGIPLKALKSPVKNSIPRFQSAPPWQITKRRAAVPPLPLHNNSSISNSLSSSSF